MYPSPVLQRPPTATYSPPNNLQQQQPGLAPGYPSRPSSSAAPQGMPVVSQGGPVGQPSSPTNVSRVGYAAARDTPKSTHYDPLSEHREGSVSWSRSPYPGRSPTQNPEHPTINTDYRHDNSNMNTQTSYRSPTNARFPIHSPTFPNLHAHPPNHHAAPTLTKSPSPRMQPNHSSISHIVNGTSEPSVGTDNMTVEAAPPIKAEPQPKRADPMSFSNILSSTNAEETKPAPPADTIMTDAPPAPKLANGDMNSIQAPTPPPASTPRKTSKATPPKERKPRKDTVRDSGRGKAGKQALVKKPLPIAKEDDKVRQAMTEIDANEKSDLESPGFETFQEKHYRLGEKRFAVVEENESARRKRQRVQSVNKLTNPLDKIVADGKNHFRHRKEEEVQAEVAHQEILDEKERKKDMQRKRRREKTVLNETNKHKELMEKYEQAEDDEEKERLLRDAEKAERKAVVTRNILDNIGGEADGAADLRKTGTLGTATGGGTTSSFNAADGEAREPARKKQKPGTTTRLKKSKEQKQAEKDMAQQAYDDMNRDEPPAILPKEEGSRRESLREPKPKKRGDKVFAEPPAPPPAAYSSKGFQQIYEQIWKDLARKDGPKAFRIREYSIVQKSSNLRKTGQLAGKEARRWQLRTNKSTKDVQARAKRCAREMMGFWKRNEREERDLRRVAERQEIESARKAEADREANRQRRKLNFLISQTELFSHFMGNKAKTDQIERSTDGVEADTTVKTDAPKIDVPDELNEAGEEVSNFEDLDFDNEDESALRKAAAANARAAIQQAQERARNFNQPAGSPKSQTDLDEGELNFQNPTSLGDTEVAQPAMLNCQLKEYQLKGLNWLVNLYEQGINGILADEMGLGKTVQSISVMAYLAEKHGIWGPFMVVAPSSTLHNWQQEIAKFVPKLKVLPYWGVAKDRKTLRKFWDRRPITYGPDAEFHVLVSSYQLVVQDQAYLQKMHWQYMVLDEAQAIKSANSSRWKTLLAFNCRNRLLLTGTPIQNNMQELWALLHFIMPQLFDSHDEFSDWFSKDIESHAQANTKLNEEQLKRLHMILKPFMLRRIKKHVQKELGDKIEKDVACDLTYRQRAYYQSLRDKINIMDLIDTVSDKKEDMTNLMNLVVQFRKVCNHPSLFTSAEITSPLALARFADCAAFAREGNNVHLGYSSRNLIEYDLPRLLCGPAGRIDVPGPDNPKAGFKNKYLQHLMNIWTTEYVREHAADAQAFSWLRFADTSVAEACQAAKGSFMTRAINQRNKVPHLGRISAIYDDGEEASSSPAISLFNIIDRQNRQPLADICADGRMSNLLNISRTSWADSGMGSMEQSAPPSASAPPIEIVCSNQDAQRETQDTFFNVPLRRALYPLSLKDELALLEADVPPQSFPPHNLLPPPISTKGRYTHVQVPSMRRFVSDCGKLARLDALLSELKVEGHRVLIYFQMTRMMDLMEEYMTYRAYKYLRLDGSTKLEDRRDRVHDFQTRPDIFVFLLSTRAGGLGINLTSADTVIFYDSDWNPTIDSQAMDRAHRLGQTRQVTVYRLITHGTVEERIRKRALQKEEVQRVVISGGTAGGVDFNTRSKENKAKDLAMWLVDNDEEAALLEQKEKEAAEKGEEAAEKKKKAGVKKAPGGGRKREINMDDMYHEGEGHFDDSGKPSGTATPANGGESDAPAGPPGKRGPRGGKGMSKKAKTAKQRLAVADGAA